MGAERRRDFATPVGLAESPLIPYRFGDFRIAERYQGPAAVPELGPLVIAQEHLEAIQASVAAGPNFAGHFSVVRWACGPGSQHFVIADVMRGAIHDGFDTRWGLDYNVESALLIADPRPPQTPDDVEAGITRYFRWTGERLVPLPHHS